MIIYFFKTILLLGIFYSLYALLLKNSKSFKWNRMYLVFTAIITVVLPWLNGLSWGTKSGNLQQNNAISVTLDSINVYAQAVNATELSAGKIIFGIYLVGFLWGMLRIILGFIVIRRIRQFGVMEKFDRQIVYFSSQIETPFSFNHHIFIPESFRDQPVLQTILQHEQAHIDQMHSRDKILFSFLQAFCWFNPFIYFYHKELELVHEFEADALTINNIGTDEYVQNILQTVTHHQTPTLLVHQFFHHPLKTRITMLYKQSKNLMVQKSAVALITLAVCLFTLFMQSYAQNKSTKNPAQYHIRTYANDTVEVEDPMTGKVQSIVTSKAPDTLYDTADLMPEFYGGAAELTKFLIENLKYPEVESAAKIEGKVVVQFTIDQTGAIGDVKAVRIPAQGENLGKEAVRVVRSMPKWKPGKQGGMAVKVNYTLPVDFKLK